MTYDHFGILLRELRESRNLTREQLALNICTPKQIYRIEKGIHEPSLYLLNQLSIKFNMDLNEYFKMFFSTQSIIGFEGIKELNKALEHGDLTSIKMLIESYEKLTEFQQGENLQHILYGKALCAALIDNNYESSLNYCMQGIEVENPDFTIENINQSAYSNVGLAIINCISCNYLAMNQPQVCLKILFDLLYAIEHYILSSPYPMYQSTDFSKKIYQNTLYNISLSLMKSGDMKQALTYVNTGIDFSLKEYNSRFLPDLLFMKFKLLYVTNDYIEAKDYYNRVIYMYKITNLVDRLRELEEDAPAEYPNIFF